MGITDAYVNIYCDAPHCSSDDELALPFVYQTQFGTGGHYDHTAVERLAKKAGWIVKDDKHFCCPECAALAQPEPEKEGR